MKKKTILFLLTLLLMTSAFAQKRTTSVKGYTRKDGTYVRPHTRGYTSGSGTTTSYGSSSAGPKDDEIAPTTLQFSNSKTKENPNNMLFAKYKDQRIALTTLRFINNRSLTDTLGSKERNTEGGVIFYVSVLRYKGRTLDVCPIPRDYSGWSFDKVEHKFDKKSLTTDDALDLISNFGWHIYNDRISKDFSYSYNDKGTPSYLTKTIEAIKVE